MTSLFRTVKFCLRYRKTSERTGPRWIPLSNLERYVTFSCPSHGHQCVTGVLVVKGEGVPAMDGQPKQIAILLQDP